MKSYRLIVEDFDGARWIFYCRGENKTHAREQALNENTVVKTIQIRKQQ